MEKARGRGMKVCIVTPDFPLEHSHGRGGVGTYSERLAEALLSRGAEVHVLIYGDAPPEKLAAKLPVQVGYITLPWVRYVSGLLPGVLQSIRLWRALRALDRRFRFDAFEMYNDEGMTLLPVIFLRSRTIFRMHSSLRQHLTHKGQPMNRQRRFAVWLDRLAARSARNLVTHSQFHANEMAAEYGLDREKIQVIPHCTPEVETAVCDSLPLVVTYIGSLDRRKGIDVFLAAVPAILQAVPAARILIVGRDTGFSSGVPWSAWFEQTFGVESRIEFTGPVSDSALEKYWSMTGILVVPSRYESFGLTVIEGFSRRKAVVASDAAALTEVARDGAIMVPPGHSEALATAVIGLLKDPDLASNVAGCGYRAYLPSYTPQIFADRIMDLYRGIAS
jgi:glycogen synthase